MWILCELQPGKSADRSAFTRFAINLGYTDTRGALFLYNHLLAQRRVEKIRALLSNEHKRSSRILYLFYLLIQVSRLNSLIMNHCCGLLMT